MGAARGCGPLDLPEGTKATCSTPGSFESVPCRNNSAVGTVATLTCKSSYKSAIPNVDSVIRKCAEELEWKQPRALVCVVECGRSQKSDQIGFIYNGEQAKADQFPWHVAIFWQQKGKPFRYICGGTLIGLNFVVTAAHCFPSNNPAEYLIGVAPQSSSFFKNEENHLMRAKKVVSHENFDPSPDRGFQEDIALVQLEKSVQVNKHVGIACLPKDYRDDPDDNAMGEVPGFGIDESGNVTDVLKFTSLPVVSYRTCLEATNRTLRPSQTQFCAGYTNGTGVCSGDSGGGMVFLNDNQYYLKGIVSHGHSLQHDDGSKTCDYKTYSMYTSVPQHLDWIMKTMNKMEANDPSLF